MMASHVLLGMSTLKSRSFNTLIAATPDRSQVLCFVQVLWECGGTLAAPAISGAVIHKTLAFIAPKLVRDLAAALTQKLAGSGQRSSTERSLACNRAVGHRAQASRRKPIARTLMRRNATGLDQAAGLHCLQFLPRRLAVCGRRRRLGT